MIFFNRSCVNTLESYLIIPDRTYFLILYFSTVTIIPKGEISVKYICNYFYTSSNSFPSTILSYESLKSKNILTIFYIQERSDDIVNLNLIWGT